MTKEKVIELIKKAYEKNHITLDLASYNLTELPQEIGELEHLKELNLYDNDLTEVPPEIGKLKNITELNISRNHLALLPPEIGELEKLTKLYSFYSLLIQLPPEIGKLKNLREINLTGNQLTLLPSEIGRLKNLTLLFLRQNNLKQLTPEIGNLENLENLDISSNQLSQLPPEISKLRNLVKLSLCHNNLTQLPPEIGNLKNLEVLDISNNQLAQLPPEIKELKNLKELYLSGNQLIQLPPGIKKLKNLTKLDLSENKFIQIPFEIAELTKLKQLDLFDNPLISPPPEIVSRGVVAVLTYLKESKTTDNNEAKLILVGNGEVGKTCLINRLINGKFVEDEITEGINISKWVISAPNLGNIDIKLNIWDFGGQEIYHATHQFFLTKRSVYILVWNARKTKDYDHIYYWLHTIEAFGEDSPIILVMSKMNESNDDLNLKDLRSKFPQIADYIKIDSYDGRGINNLIEIIGRTAWDLPLMRAKWVDSWYRVRQKLEESGENWITYDRFYKTCKSEGLDDKNVNVLDDYLNDLGVTLHFKDSLALENIVILKPEWATSAFYKILSTKFVLDNEGILQRSELSQIWDIEAYPSFVYSQLMELMNKFELAYELPDKNSYLIAELLSKNEPDFRWDEENNLSFYYCYSYFLPSSIITRFIVRMHKVMEKKENGKPFCWREGAILELQNSHALVRMKPDEREIEIRVKGDNKRGALGAICNEIDQINGSIKKISVSKQIPCNCSDNCPQRYPYERLLKAEINNIETMKCLESFKDVSISFLLAGYKRKVEGFNEYNEQSGKTFIKIISQSHATADSNTVTKVKQNTEVGINVTLNLKVDLPQIQAEFADLRREIKSLSPELKNELDEIQDSLDGVSADSENERLKKPFNKLGRFLKSLSDPDSDNHRIITGTQKGMELAQKVVETYNKVAPLLGILVVHGIN